MLRGKGAGRKNNTALGVRRGSFCINDINMLLMLRLLMVSLSFPSGFRHKNSLEVYHFTLHKWQLMNTMCLHVTQRDPECESKTSSICNTNCKRHLASFFLTKLQYCIQRYIYTIFILVITQIVGFTPLCWESTCASSCTLNSGDQNWAHYSWS